MGTIQNKQWVNSGPKREINAWRCDLHPVWSRDFKFIAFNGRPDNGSRQVLVSYMGDESFLKELFRKYKNIHI